MTPEQLQDGALCQLNIGKWDASVRMDKNKLGKNVPKEIVRAMQDLVDERDKYLVKDLNTVKRSTKNMLVQNSLPFPVNGVFWVPKEKIPTLDAAFEEAKTEYFLRRDALKRKLPLIKRRFKQKYPKFYQDSFYPNRAGMDKRYRFTWNFFHFVVPDKKTEVLSAKMYKREQEKFQNMVTEMEQLTLNLIGNALLERIERLKNQCDNETVNAGTVHSVERFMDKWNELWSGKVDNKKMQGIIKSMRIQMKRTSADRLKNNDDFREKTGEKLEKIIKRIKNVPNLELKRRMDV